MKRAFVFVLLAIVMLNAVNNNFGCEFIPSSFSTFENTVIPLNIFCKYGDIITYCPTDTNVDVLTTNPHYGDLKIDHIYLFITKDTANYITYKITSSGKTATCSVGIETNNEKALFYI